MDIGGYIGDFSIYAVKYLNAARVIVYEPTAENFELLKRNIEDNRYADRITAVNSAVSDSNQVVLNVQKREADEVHVSSTVFVDLHRLRRMNEKKESQLAIFSHMRCPGLNRLLASQLQTKAESRMRG